MRFRRRSLHIGQALIRRSRKQYTSDLIQTCVSERFSITSDWLAAGCHSLSGNPIRSSLLGGCFLSLQFRLKLLLFVGYRRSISFRVHPYTLVGGFLQPVKLFQHSEVRPMRSQKHVAR
jgi:hypothetical protein